MDVQLEAVRQDICGVKERIAKTEQKLAAAELAEQARNKLFELLLKLQQPNERSAREGEHSLTPPSTR